MKDTIIMSTKEADRLSILERLKKKEIKQKTAADLLDLSARQVRRLLKRYNRDGATGIVHKLRGGTSNNAVNAAVIAHAVSTYQTTYPDFTITMAHEKLVAYHQFPYGQETLRVSLIAAGLWHPKRQAKPVIHQMRQRRACEGELVQVDGSPHHWFEDRGPYCTLLVYIDDATGKLKWLAFVESETTNAYFAATKNYLLLYGKPVAVYSDKHGVFRINTTKYLSAAAYDSNGLTQFGRALKDLSITAIFAHTPQAKGRVERANQTLQDRLVKELRLRGIATLEAGNRYLPEFISEFNRKFSVVPTSSLNMHRPLSPTEQLDNILVQKHQRILSKQLSVSYANTIYQIVTNRPLYAMRQASVTVIEDNSGRIRIMYGKEELAYQIMTIQPKSEIVDTKHINQKLDQTIQRMRGNPPSSHPWKQPYLYW